MEWINIDSNPPKKNQIVIFWNERNKCCVIGYKKGKSFFNLDTGVKIGIVTHWMNQPLPPKK